MTKAETILQLAKLMGGAIIVYLLWLIKNGIQRI